MAAKRNAESELQLQSKLQLANATHPVERLRWKCLARGAAGIKGLGRMFRVIDDNGNRRIERDEFHKGLQERKILLSKEEEQQMFDTFDRNHSGYIDFDEFLIVLRPPMSQMRQNVVMQAFQKLDKTGEGVIQVDDLEGVYNVDKDPKYISGEKTKDQLLKEFLTTFEVSDHPDGIVTKEEFFNYYSGISASIDNDLHFDLMMRKWWKL